MHDLHRTANLLGAASLALTDLALSDATHARRLSTSSSAAMVSLHANPGLSVSELGRRVGLSQPAACRMVDSLEADGLVQRVQSSINRRWTTVQPTPEGDELTLQLLEGHNAPLAAIVEKLDDSDQQTLTGLLEKILTHLYNEVGEAQRICRLCDRDSCAQSAPCPVGQAERREEDT